MIPVDSKYVKDDPRIAGVFCVKLLIKTEEKGFETRFDDCVEGKGFFEASTVVYDKVDATRASKLYKVL